MLSTIFSYLLGSIPFGYLIARFKGIDIRQHGSGNIGATNVVRVLGKKYGIPVFILDFLKGLLPIFMVSFWLNPQEISSLELSMWKVFAGLASILGHTFPIWLGFKGGKGVATTAGVLLGLLPQVLPFALVGWLITFKWTRMVAAASVMAALIVPVGTVLIGFIQGHWDWPLIFFSMLVAVLVIWRHRSNLIRISQGTEPRFVKKSKTHATLTPPEIKEERP